MQGISIREFATQILEHKETKEALAEYYATRNVADRLTDTCVGFRDTGGFPLYDEYEENAYSRIVSEMNHSIKSNAVDRLSNALPVGSPLGQDYHWRHTFRCFCNTPEFTDYLLFQRIPYTLGTTDNFTLHKLLCLYLWLWKHDTSRWRGDVSMRTRLVISHRAKLSQNDELDLQFDSPNAWGGILLDGKEFEVNDGLLAILEKRFAIKQ